MAEYLIRTSASHDWPAFHSSRMAEVLLPAGLACHVLDGTGDFRMRCGQMDVSFSVEDVGWHVVIEGALHEGDQLVDIVTRQIETVVGEACEWLPLD